MRIVSLATQPLDSMVCLSASARGRPEPTQLPLLEGRVSALPDGVAGILVTSDLQGVVPDPMMGGESRLLGEALVDAYLELAERGRVPDPAATGVMLAGDLYSSPDAAVRGATGDVRSVWEAFAAEFRWVVGVAGNHDTFGSDRQRDRFLSRTGACLLDGEVVALDGLSVGGVSYIAGDPAKKGRRSEAEIATRLRSVLAEQPDVLMLHEGPTGARSQRGSDSIRQLLDEQAPELTVCGHRPWEEPMFELAAGGQVLNVDHRAVVLTGERAEWPAT